jgi:hypothetical protein
MPGSRECDRRDLRHRPFSRTLWPLIIAEMVTDTVSLVGLYAGVGGRCMWVSNVRLPSNSICKLLDSLRDQWRALDPQKQQNIKSAGGLVEGLGEILDSIKVLFIIANPTTPDGPLQLAEEQRAVKFAIKSGQMGAKIFIEDLPAARANDFRSALLASNFQVIHFSGHANSTSLVFEDEQNQPDFVGLDAVAQIVASHPTIKCVVLNACESVQNLSVSISPITIGMDKTIADGAAIEFSRGFYDALGNGLSFERAFEEGRNAVKLKGFDDNLIKMIKAHSK